MTAHVSALIAIADQSDMPLWGVTGWSVALLVAGAVAVVVHHREHLRRHRGR